MPQFKSVYELRDWPLGLFPDGLIARNAGCAPQTVQSCRKKWCIPSFSSTQPKIDWDSLPLGDKPDQEVGDMVGRSADTVRQVRIDRGIAEFSRTRIYLNLPPMRDVDAANVVGLSPRRIRQIRYELNLPMPVPRDCTRKHIKWDDQPLGKMSDNALAKKLRVSEAAVYKARKSRGIPSYSSQMK